MAGNLLARTIDRSAPPTRMQRTHNILLNLDRAYAFDRRAFNGIAEMANARGDVRLSWIAREEEWANEIRDREPDGIITARMSPEDEAVLAKTNLPLVCLADWPKTPSIGSVVANDEHAIGAAAAQHFLDSGYRSFAVVTRPGRRELFANRIGAFIETVGDRGFACPIGPPAMDASNEGGEAVHERLWDITATEWIKQLPRPVAIFAPYDSYAQVAVDACRQAGLRVPDDVAVIGVDDDETYCMTTSPNLSSVVTPAKRIGEAALTTLLAELAGKKPMQRRMLFPPSGVVVRGSSSSRAINDPDLISAVRYIRERAAEPIRVMQVAQHVLLSRRTLERRFLGTLGHTVMDEIRQAKVRRATQLLLDTDLSFKEVARRSGLVHQQRMNRLIKIETGLTPAQFRRQGPVGARR